MFSAMWGKVMVILLLLASFAGGIYMSPTQAWCTRKRANLVRNKIDSRYSFRIFKQIARYFRSQFSCADSLARYSAERNAFYCY